MNKEQLQGLLDSYYRAETDLSQEEILRDKVQDTNDFVEESDVFAYFREEAFVPGNLETEIFNRIVEKDINRRKIRIRYLRISSVAAAVLILFSILLLKPQSVPVRQLTVDEQFFVLEQALSQVSYSLQPEEDDDLLVVFQDENFEIVMN